MGLLEDIATLIAALIVLFLSVAAVFLMLVLVVMVASWFDVYWELFSLATWEWSADAKEPCLQLLGVLLD